MKNYGRGSFWDIYRFEIKKIVGRKQLAVTFLVVFIITLLLNLYSIPLYSVGTEGAQAETGIENAGDTGSGGWTAMLKGIDIRWIDEEGNTVEKKVGPVSYIRIQRKFAEQWSGKALDNTLIHEMQSFLASHDDIDENGCQWSWNYQNYYWVNRSITKMGLNPYSKELSEKLIEKSIKNDQIESDSEQQLTKEEKDFWKDHGEVSLPLRMAYTPAYSRLISNSRWIHLLLVFFTIIALSESFSFERRRNTRQVMLSTAKGSYKAAVPRLLAGETVAAGAGIIMYAISAMIQFGLFGMDGWNAPIQQLGGLQLSRLNITAGNAILLLTGTSLLILLMMGALTMILSELFQNAVAALSVQSAFLIYTEIFDYGLFYIDRNKSQLWQYFPIQRVSEHLLCDERLVSVGGHLMTTIPLSTWIYAGLAVILLALCYGHAWIKRIERF